MPRELTDAEVDQLLERYDQTDPKLQRWIVAEFAARLEQAREACAAAYDHLDTHGTVSGGSEKEMASQRRVFDLLRPFRFPKR